MIGGEHKVWTNLLWRQRKVQRTSWWQCFRAHLALELGLWDTVVPEFNTKHIEMAGRAVGQYSTYCGVGTAFEILHLRGFRVCITEDGSL